MYTEYVTVNYKGFKPNQDTEAELKAITDRLQDEAPSESSLNATFTKARGNEYSGCIRIHFSEGIFSARADAYDLKTVIEKIVLRLREQLNRWKSVRFGGELSYGASY